MSGVFQGRSLLVIGASSGIGAELTRQLLDQGAHVIAWGRRNPGDEQTMPGLTYAAWDVLSGEDPPTASLPETLHGLVYLPGSIPLKPFHRTSPDDFRQTMEINLLGAVRAVQAALPALKQSGDASVVLMGTVASRIGMPFHSAIAAAKSALRAWSSAWPPNTLPNASASTSYPPPSHVHRWLRVCYQPPKKSRPRPAAILWAGWVNLRIPPRWCAFC